MEFQFDRNLVAPRGSNTSGDLFDCFKLREECLYLKLFWSALSRIRTEYGESRSIPPCSIGMRENADQNNSEYGHFLRSVIFELL